MKEAVIAMGKKAERLGADIRLNTPVTKELIAEIKPHTVFNAIGSFVTGVFRRISDPRRSAFLPDVYKRQLREPCKVPIGVYPGNPGKYSGRYAVIHAN